MRPSLEKQWLCIVGDRQNKARFCTDLSVDRNHHDGPTERMLQGRAPKSEIGDQEAGNRNSLLIGESVRRMIAASSL